MRVGACNQLALKIVHDSFAEVVATIVKTLLTRNALPLRLVKAESQCSLGQARQALAIGIQHNFISHSTHKRGYIEYSVVSHYIIERLYHPAFIYCAKILYGEVAEVIVEEILRHGQVLQGKLLDSAVTRLNASLTGTLDKVTIHKANAVLQRLIEATFVVRSEVNDGVNATETQDTPPAKKARLNEEVVFSCCVNSSRFLMYLRDQCLIKAIKDKLGDKEAEVLRTMLRLSEVKSDPQGSNSYDISNGELFGALPKDVGITSRGQLDLYLNSLSEDSLKIVTKSGDAGGGQHIIKFSSALRNLVLGHMQSIVQERFGSKSLRIFRILMLKDHLEQKQVEELAMIPSKMAKELLYELFSHGYISTTEVAKTSDHAPSRTFYCFRVPNEGLTRTVMNYMYHSILNLRTKKTAINAENKRVVEKQQKVAAILATLGDTATEEQKLEVSDMITQSERRQLDLLKQQNRRLDQAEQQLVEGLLIFQLHLNYLQLERSQKPDKKIKPLIHSHLGSAHVDSNCDDFFVLTRTFSI